MDTNPTRMHYSTVTESRPQPFPTLELSSAFFLPTSEKNRPPDSGMCACMQADHSPARTLQDCLLSAAQGNQFWLQGPDLNTKLWGSVIDLNLPAQPMTLSGLRIWMAVEHKEEEN